MPERSLKKRLSEGLKIGLAKVLVHTPQSFLDDFDFTYPRNSNRWLDILKEKHMRDQAEQLRRIYAELPPGFIIIAESEECGCFKPESADPNPQSINTIDDLVTLAELANKTGIEYCYYERLISYEGGIRNIMMMRNEEVEHYVTEQLKKTYAELSYDYVIIAESESGYDFLELESVDPNFHSLNALRELVTLARKANKTGDGCDQRRDLRSREGKVTSVVLMRNDRLEHYIAEQIKETCAGLPPGFVIIAESKKPEPEYGLFDPGMVDPNLLSLSTLRDFVQKANQAKVAGDDYFYESYIHNNKGDIVKIMLMRTDLDLKSPICK